MVDTFKQKGNIIRSIFYDDLAEMIMQFVPDDKVISSKENFKYVKEELKMVSGRSQLVFKFIAHHKSLLSIRNKCRSTHLSWVWDDIDYPITSIFDEDGHYSGPTDSITDWGWHESDYSIIGYGQDEEPVTEEEEAELSDLDDAEDEDPVTEDEEPVIEEEEAEISDLDDSEEEETEPSDLDDDF